MLVSNRIAIDGKLGAGRGTDGRVALLVSVNVGMPQDVDWHGRAVHTGAWKHPVEGPRMARRLNLEGDGQGDLHGHGGEQRAVLVYQVASYRYWREHLGCEDLTYGNFGENLTVDALPDDEVCIGDRYLIGEAEFEVTQPRVTCYRVGMRLGHPDLPSLLVSHRRPGFYMRVISEGRVHAGDAITKTRIGPGHLSVAATDALLYLPDRNPTKLRTAVQIPALSPGWRQSFDELLAGVGPDQAVVPRPEGPAWSGFRPLRVTSVTRETPSVISIRLGSAAGTPLPAARAGQHVTLRVPGAGEPAPVRSYSLSGASDSGTYRVTVKQERNGVVSSYLHRDLVPGDTLEVAAPRGEFVVDDGTGAVLLFSGGIGLTPLLAMLHELAAGHTQREVWWVHTARGPQEHALRAEAHGLLRSLPHAQERIFYTAGPEHETPPEGANTGRLTAERMVRLGLPVSGATAYICGPSRFMDAIREALTSIGVAGADIRTELFGAHDAINPGLVAPSAGSPHAPAGPPGTGALVTFARSGLSVRFGTGARTILELAESCDVPTRWTCRSGVCHTCLTPLLDGRVSYQPEPLEPAAPEYVLVCSARPDTDVVVDL